MNLFRKLFAKKCCLCKEVLGNDVERDAVACKSCLNRVESEVAALQRHLPGLIAHLEEELAKEVREESAKEKKGVL